MSRHSANPVLVALALRLKSSALELRSSRARVARWIGLVTSAVYRALSLYVLGFDIPTTTKLGRNVLIHHTFGLVIHDRAEIGDEVHLRQNTTIGAKVGSDAAPIIGRGVDIGANVVILGNVRVGDYAVVGAGSVVLSDVPRSATVVGNPARVVRVGPSAGSREV